VLFVDVEPPQEIIADDDNATNKHCNMCLICTCFIIEILLNEKIINAQISYHPNNSKEKFLRSTYRRGAGRYYGYNLLKKYIRLI